VSSEASSAKEDGAVRELRVAQASLRCEASEGCRAGAHLGEGGPSFRSYGSASQREFEEVRKDAVRV
jgi:hypothetical protein